MEEGTEIISKVENEAVVNMSSSQNPSESDPSTAQQRSYVNPRAAAVGVPASVLEAVYAFGEHKAAEPLGVLSMQSFQAGLFKSIACQLYLTVGGGVIGGALFPVGLIAILLTGAELFTSDSLFMVATFLGGKVRYTSLLRNLAVSWTFNFCGAVFWAAFLTYFPNQLESAGQVEFAVYTAEHKADQPWYQIFLNGIGANFLIALAVWQCTTAKDVAGKVLAIWFPVAAFVILGFDHCIANMYYITIGMLYGANISVVHFLFSALLPATLGNLVGGGVGIGFVYWYLYDSLASRERFRQKIREALIFPLPIGDATPRSADHGA